MNKKLLISHSFIYNKSRLDARFVWSVGFIYANSNRKIFKKNTVQKKESQKTNLYPNGITHQTVVNEKSKSKRFSGLERFIYGIISFFLYLKKE